MIYYMYFFFFFWSRYIWYTGIDFGDQFCELELWIFQRKKATTPQRREKAIPWRIYKGLSPCCYFTASPIAYINIYSSEGG